MRGFVTLLAGTRRDLDFQTAIYEALDLQHKHQSRVADLWNVGVMYVNFDSGIPST